MAPTLKTTVKSLEKSILKSCAVLAKARILLAEKEAAKTAKAAKAEAKAAEIAEKKAAKTAKAEVKASELADKKRKPSPKDGPNRRQKLKASDPVAYEALLARERLSSSRYRAKTLEKKLAKEDEEMLYSLD